MKTKYIIIGIIFPIFILAISFLACLFIEPKPLVIIAGGGSVSNYLESMEIKLKEPNFFPNSVYINMPSGYVQQLLIEEIKRFGEKSKARQPFLNISLLDNKIVDWNILDKPFLYIGLSAEKIDNDSLFNSEYAQVYEYYIGDDTLAVYYVDKNNQQHQDIIDIDKFVNDLMTYSQQGNIHTTTTKSGTLKAYENYLKEYITTTKSDTLKANKNNSNERKDSTKLMGILNSAKKFFEGDTIPKNSMVLSSYSYPPTNYEKGSTIKRSTIKDKNKKLYIYFIGYKSRDNIYKPNSQVIDFLNKLYDKKHPNEKKKDLSDERIWKIAPSKRKSIINFDPTNNNSY